MKTCKVQKELDYDKEDKKEEGFGEDLEQA